MRPVLASALVLLLIPALARAAEDPLAKDLLSDAIFMKAHWRMEIEATRVSDDSLVVRTTGAVFDFRPLDSVLLCSQRIGKAREVLGLTFPEGFLKGLRIDAADTGAVILRSDGGLLAKVNCDSLLMLRASREAIVSMSLRFPDEVSYHTGDNRLWIDSFGAVGVYPIKNASLAPGGEPQRSPAYAVGVNGELWIVVAPPRPYPWKESMELRPLWQGTWESPQAAVPSDEKIRSYVGRGNLLWLQSEVMLWKDWHNAFEPRLPDELRRVIRTSHALGLRVMVYASPFYFTRGVGGNETFDGTNVGLYLQALEDYLREFPETDGIYFDGLYGRSVANTYVCCRATRELIGDERVLMVHCTHNAPGGAWGKWSYNPAADTWADCTLRGEGFGFVSSPWLRCFVSGYQTSNAIGFLCNNAGYYAPSRRQVEMVLRANCRLPYMTCDTDGWLRDAPVNPRLKEPASQTKAKHVRAMTDWYYPRLDDALREWFEKINEARAFEVAADLPD
ncbi:MAG: hypothetical protein V2A58_00045 [Planctomycetota bacterium]